MGSAVLSTLVKAALVLLAGAALGVGAAVAVLGTSDDNGTPAAAQVQAARASEVRDSSALTVNEIYRRAGPGVVEIMSSSESGSFGDESDSSQGSGFVLDSDGHVITNAHVVENAASISVRFPDGTRYDARLVGSDVSTDIAVLKISAPADKLHPLELGSSKDLEVGDSVVAIGSPFGLEGSVTTGIVSGLDREITAQNGFAIEGAIQTDAAINHGNSGGPLLDAQGRAIGVTSQIESGSGGNDGVGFAVPSDTVRKVADELIASGKVEHAFLGVRLADDEGARVAAVVPNGPAADGGLRVGDRVVRAGGERVSSASDLRRIIDAHDPGDELDLRVVRNGRTVTVHVELGTRPEE
jgi:putative serine protease PepD